MSSLKTFFIVFCISVLLVAIISLISYYFSKKMVKWLKNVQRIDNRGDLDKSPKMKEIVWIVREVSQIYRIKMPEVGVYPSGEVNAFATGPAHDTLIAFSSNLINIMSMEEIRGVVGHELSHLIHYDLKRILLVQGAFDALHLTLSFFLKRMIFQNKSKEEREKTGGIISEFFNIMLFQIITSIMRFIGILIVLWYNRKRELAADLRGAKIVGVDTMIATLRKLLALENKAWIVDGIDLTEDENVQQGEPNSLSLLKFNPEKKKRGFLDLLRTHPTLEERIARLKKLEKEKNRTGII